MGSFSRFPVSGAVIVMVVLPDQVIQGVVSLDHTLKTALVQGRPFLFPAKHFFFPLFFFKAYQYLISVG